MIKHDLKRAFGKQFVLSIFLSLIIMALIVLERKDKGTGVFSIMEDILSRCEYMIVFAMAIMPYAYVFAEDSERKTVYQVLIRAELKKYVFSKILFICISTISVIFISFVLFVAGLKSFGEEWISYDLVIKPYELNGIGFCNLELWPLLERHHDMMFYCIAGLQMGLLSGVVALAAALLSLFIKNRMMVMILPVICLYTLYKYLNGIVGYEYGIYALFNCFYNYNWLGNHIFLWALITAVLMYLILSILIYFRIKRMVRYE